MKSIILQFQAFKIQNHSNPTQTTIYAKKEQKIIIVQIGLEWESRHDTATRLPSHLCLSATVTVIGQESNVKRAKKKHKP